jgi:hypothetical protein
MPYSEDNGPVWTIRQKRTIYILGATDPWLLCVKRVAQKMRQRLTQPVASLK